MESDPTDIASEREEIARQSAIYRCRAPLPPGVQGECRECGEFSLRLIGGACAPCRDTYRMP